MPTKPASKRVPKDEPARDKFVRLANGRGSKALAAIENLGKLGAGRYERTQADTDKVFGALEASLKNARAIWETPKASTSKESVTIL